jgi:hypothetical protein
MLPNKVLPACVPNHLVVYIKVGKLVIVNPAIAPPTVPTVSAFSICFASSSFPCSRRSSLA